MKNYVMGYWRTIKTRCENPECGRVTSRVYEIRSHSVSELSDDLKKLVPVGRYCPYCAKKMAEAVTEVINESKEDASEGI